MEAFLGVLFKLIADLFGEAVLRAITGGQTDEDAIASARKAADLVPHRVPQWDTEDDARDARIRREGES